MLVCKTRLGYLFWLTPKVLSGRGYTTAFDIGVVAATVIELADGKPFLYGQPKFIVRQRISYSTRTFLKYRMFTSCVLKFVHVACVRSVQEWSTAVELLQMPSP